MGDTAQTLAGLSYPRLVPATLMPPEDPSRVTNPHRTFRDWFVDSLLFVLALGAGVLFYAGNLQDSLPVPAWVRALDVVLGVLASASLWARRRWPVGVAIVTCVVATVSVSAAPASVIALFGVAVHRRSSVAFTMVAVNLVSSALFAVLRPSESSFWFSMAVSVVIVAIVTAWGMFVRARRQLVWTLRERAERAESEQRLHAERARAAERTRIAREMHDVLGHRISLLALHAGGLQLRPDLPPEQVQQTAALLRDTAQQALQELRGVIGVLRETSGGEAATGAGEPVVPAPPQPRLRDIARLVADSREAGGKITLDLALTSDDEPPGTIGRDAYRIVQEALTNVAKHAHGTATTVRVSGGPGEGLLVEVRNRLPVTAGSALPGSGTGLLGLRERVTLTGGSIEHGPSGDGDFVVSARLSW